MIEIMGPQLYQWDVGRVVSVSGDATHVHFANRGDSKAFEVAIADGQALIPDFLLWTGKSLVVYLVQVTDRDPYGITLESKTFSVTNREKPENYIYEDDQRNYIYRLITNAQEATEAAYKVANDLTKAKENGEFTGPKGDPGTAMIDDSAVGEAAWSSKNTVDKLCPAFTESGPVVLCEPVEGYPLEVKCSTKNLFDDVAFYMENGFVQQEDGTWYGSQKNKTIFTNTEGLPGPFTISGYGMRMGPSLVFQVFYTDGTSKYSTTIPYNEFGTMAFTTAASKTVDRIDWLFQDFGNFYIKDVQIEYGSTATPYEPYADAILVNRCGKNLIDYESIYAAQQGYVKQEDGFWYGPNISKGLFYNVEKIPGPFTMSYYGKHETYGALAMEVRYTDGTRVWATGLSAELATHKFTTDPNKTVDKILQQYGYAGKLYIKDIQVEYGTAATPYEPFKGIDSFNVGDPVPALPGVNTIYADCGLVTVTGRADPVATIDKLTNAILALGGNI